MPLISVCLATYNGERFLAEQIQSVLDQSFGDFELVVSDDGSTDRTCDILEAFAARDRRIRILPSGSRLGMQKNFERVIAASAGSYVAPCDQDDVWRPEKLDVLLRHLRERDVAMVYCDSDFIDEQGRALGGTLLQVRGRVHGRDALVFAFRNCVSGHAMLFDRRILDDALPFPAQPFYDWWLAAVATASGGISLVDRQLVLYRRHEDSVSEDLRRKERAGSRRDPFRRNAEETRRLAAFVRVPGRASIAFRKLHELWSRRADALFIPELTLFLLRHPSVFAMHNASAARTWWRCVMRGVGLPLRHPLLARKLQDNSPSR